MKHHNCCQKNYCEGLSERNCIVKGENMPDFTNLIENLIFNYCFFKLLIYYWGGKYLTKLTYTKSECYLPQEEYKKIRCGPQN